MSRVHVSQWPEKFELAEQLFLLHQLSFWNTPDKRFPLGFYHVDHLIPGFASSYWSLYQISVEVRNKISKVLMPKLNMAVYI